jgi:pimeloyl-ACP methyl ester carboxylesterase
MQPELFVRRSAAAHDRHRRLGGLPGGGPSIVAASIGQRRPGGGVLAGGDAVGLDYLNLQQRAAELATSVIYDRAGTGWSQRVELPRASAEVIEKLRALLSAAEVPAPYLLVGHSLGGLYARHYAQQYSGDVSGLVLLDPAHEDYNA